MTRAFGQSSEMTLGRDVSLIMRQVHSRNTTPEINFRKVLREAGITYRLRTDELPGKPDLIIPKAKLAVFIDGDYWHGGQWVTRGLTCLENQFRKSENASYWLKKIRSNMLRDVNASAALLGHGWRVLRLWESSINKNVDHCLRLVKQACEGRTDLSCPESLIAYKTVAEFFAGIGLVRIGLESHNWRIVYANDIDQKKFQMYRDHFADEHKNFDLKDIRDVKAEDIPDVTLATASFPCNDTSLAGARKGLSGEKSASFWEFVRILEQMRSRRPPIVMIENVTGFLTSSNGHDLAAALKALNDLGYLVDTFQVDALYFTPQSRKRLFVVGMEERMVLGDPWWGSSGEIEESPLRPKKLADFIRNNDHIKWLIRNLPTPVKQKSTLCEYIDEVADDDSLWWSNSRAEYLLGQMNPSHLSRAEAMIDGSEYSYGTIFRRVRQGITRAELRSDGIAGCLRTPRGGSARQILFKGGRRGFKVRLLTARECARLMGAENYKIEVPEHQALYGFGDAVVVPVMEWIATYYLDPLVNQLLRGRILAPLDACKA